jgi:glutamate N-acetyltransferase/amino-acid N-acetyltransferase
VSTGVTAPRGFRAAGVAAGIKEEGPDLALVVAEAPCAAAGVFTQSRTAAAPVAVAREALASGRALAIVVNSGCANAATGARGLDDAREMTRLAATAVGCSPEDVVVASTGVIGVPLPMDRVRTGIADAAGTLSGEGGGDAARAIMTTDTKPKEASVELKLGGVQCAVGGMAKGAGMIAPNMATMLAFFTSDVAIEPALLHRALTAAVGESLNRITVDGDTSTNDCAVVLASGAAGAPAISEEGPDYEAFREALTEVGRRLARKLVGDGEGVTRVAEVRVEGASTPADADRIARVVAESPLVKTALHGGDPNWGRVLAAVGRAGVEIDGDRVSIWIGDVRVAENGAAVEYEETRAAGAMEEDPVRIRIDLGGGEAEGWMWTSDLSHGYVEINAHYRT